jgi:V8-like Glu-specific endopeptidase
MPPNDVVRHDLDVSSAFPDSDDVEPMPMPVIGGEGLEGALEEEPVTTKITGPAIEAGPYRSVGKMKMKFPTDENAIGASGWVVAPRAFITAGHCVYFVGKGGWIESSIFCPQFDGKCSTTTYQVERVYTLRGWIDNKDNDDREYDLAACVVTEAFWDQEPPLEFDTFPVPALNFAGIGYPSNPIPGYDYNGKRMWQSAGKLIKATGSVMWAVNNLSNGASGGPWCEPDNKWIVSGINSARHLEIPNICVSPVLGEGFQNLYDAVKDAK